MCTVQISAPHFYLKSVSWEHCWGCWRPRRGRDWARWLSESSPWVSWWSHLLKDLLCHFTPTDWLLYNLTYPLSSIICPGQSARGSPAWRWPIWWLYDCSGGRYHSNNARHMQEKTQVKMIIPLPIDNCFQEPHNPKPLVC